MAYVQASGGSLLPGSTLVILGGCYITAGEDGYSTGYARASGYCEVGEQGCPCTSSGLCNEGFVCIASENVCALPDACPIGARGCECTAGGSCAPGNVCKENVCVSDAPCLPEFIGTEGCQCTLGGGCDPGLSCFSDVCVHVPRDAGDDGPGPGDGDTGIDDDGDESTGEAPSDATGTTGIVGTSASVPDDDGEASTSGPVGESTEGSTGAADDDAESTGVPVDGSSDGSTGA